MVLRAVPLRWIGLASVAVVFNKHFYTVKIVTGRSMQPTLNPDSSIWRDVVLFNRTVVGMGHKCKRGDIVALRSPVEPGELIVKRVVALGGDVVQTLPPYPDTEVLVPVGYMWVEGDERFHTRDSNSFGPVPLALLDANVSFVLWPPPRFGPLRSPSAVFGSRTPIHSPVWRQERDAADRERWRNARVRVAQNTQI